MRLRRPFVEVAVDVVKIASGPGRIEQQAEAILDSLRRLVPFQAAWISVVGERQQHVPVVTQAHTDPVNTYFPGSYAAGELEMPGVHPNQPPISLRDLPMPPGELRAWAEHYRPAGFRDGVGIGLFTPDGRHFGHLGLLTDSAEHPTETARDLIGQLAPAIAAAVDPMRSITAIVPLMRDAEAGIVLSRDGNTLPLTGLPSHPLLAPGSAVLTTVAGQLTGTHGHLTFLCPGPEGYARITMLTFPPQPPLHLTAVVTVSPPGDLNGLTRNELEILGMLIDGWPDGRIAAVLNRSRLHVAEAIERIVVKLAAPSRLTAVLQASRHGLYVPPSVNTSRNSTDRPDAGDPRGARSRPPDGTRLPGLTVRETEVAELIAGGHTNGQIAQMLLIGRRTVESHVEHILQKLAFHSRTQVAAWVATTHANRREPGR